MKLRKNIFIITTVLLASFTFMSGACMDNYSYIDPGDLVKQDRKVKDFHAIDVGGAFEVYLAQGNDVALSIEAGEKIIDKIITKVEGKTLKIYLERGCCKNTGKMVVYLTFVDLKYMDISGACEIYNKGTLNFDDLEMDLSGASEVNMDMKLNRLEVDLSGASDIDFEGSCEQLYLDASGASEIDALNFKVGSMVLDASGASDCKVYVTGELEVEASGATSVRYKGNPKVSSSQSGASSIKPY